MYDWYHIVNVTNINLTSKNYLWKKKKKKRYSLRGELLQDVEHHELLALFASKALRDIIYDHTYSYMIPINLGLLGCKALYLDFQIDHQQLTTDAAEHSQNDGVIFESLANQDVEVSTVDIYLQDVEEEPNNNSSIINHSNSLNLAVEDNSVNEEIIGPNQESLDSHVEDNRSPNSDTLEIEQGK